MIIQELLLKKLTSLLPEYPIKECSLEEAAASDIVCTLTPSRVPFLKKDYVRPGTHINAVGADAEGKEELDPSILKEAVVVVDDLRQASIAGEINVPVTRGLFAVDDVYATLGEMIVGRKQGRTNNDVITVFDSTGVAIEDVATAKLIYQRAKQTGICTYIDIV